MPGEASTKHSCVSRQKRIPSPVRSLPPRATAARIVRVPIFHEGTFRTLLLAACEGLCCFRHRHRFWHPLEVGEGFGLYCLVPDPLSILQQRVEEYEFFIYSQLLNGCCGADEVLRPRTHLCRARNGACRLSNRSRGDRA